MADIRPIIVIKKKVAHAGHHGGAWKVAYADFVTALMALFIVLWLMNSSKPIQVAVSGYFKDPTGKSLKVGNGLSGQGTGITLSKQDMDKLKDELEKSIQKMANFDKIKDQIEITLTSEGLRIELLETDVGTFFESGVPQPSSSGTDVLIKLAQELGKLPNKILLEGHTDSKPFTRDGYTNWELSTERANAARRLMQENGLGPNQVSQVRGYADQLLRKPDKPQDASNRRISVIVMNLEKPLQEDKEEGEKGAKGAKGEKSEKGGKPAPEHKAAAEPAKPAKH